MTLATITPKPIEPKKAKRGEPPPAESAEQPLPCIVYWTGKKGFLEIVVVTYCQTQFDAAIGVTQLPDKALHNGMLCPKCVEEFTKYGDSL